MKHNIVAAIIIAVGLIVAAFLNTGRYHVLAVDKGVAVRVDRWTGESKTIRTHADAWGDLPAPKSN